MNTQLLSDTLETLNVEQVHTVENSVIDDLDRVINMLKMINSPFINTIHLKY
jgi:hypothetical protein